MRTPNTTNLHTHGMHMDPATDSIFLEAHPGGNLTYEYTIPPNHAPGVHWYHSHRHGATAMQVMGGLLGALIVDFPGDETPPEALASMEEHLLVLTHVSACSCNPTTDPFRIVDYMELSDAIINQLDPDFEFADEDVKDVYLTNGQFQPSLTIQPGEWHRFELINAVGDTYLEVEVRTEIDGGDSVCPACRLHKTALLCFFSRANYITITAVSVVMLVLSRLSCHVHSCATCWFCARLAACAPWAGTVFILTQGLVMLNLC
jgi:hypothetical protein